MRPRRPPATQASSQGWGDFLFLSCKGTPDKTAEGNAAENLLNLELLGDCVHLLYHRECFGVRIAHWHVLHLHLIHH